MSRYQIKPYRAGGWVLIEISNGLEIFVFDEKPKAEIACLYLNEDGENSGTRLEEEASKPAEGR